MNRTAYCELCNANQDFFLLTNHRSGNQQLSYGSLQNLLFTLSFLVCNNQINLICLGCNKLLNQIYLVSNHNQHQLLWKASSHNQKSNRKTSYHLQICLMILKIWLMMSCWILRFCPSFRYKKYILIPIKHNIYSCYNVCYTKSNM